jgi:hypothetical protein
MEIHASSPDGFTGVPGKQWDFQGSHEVQSLTKEDFTVYAPVSYREFGAGYYRNFNGHFDSVIYSAVATVAKDRHPDDELQQKALIAAYFKWRGISWEGVA